MSILKVVTVNMMMPCARVITLAIILTSACHSAPASNEYQLTGQILGIKTSEQEVLIKHSAIEDLMPSMTMPFPVRNAALLEGKEPGDLVTATLVVERTTAYLSTLTKTGRAPLDVPPPAETTRSGFELLRKGDTVGDEFLIDQDGNPRPLSSLRGHRLAITFIYTRCPIPTFCPLMDKNFSALQDRVRDSQEFSDVRLLSISFDPEFDTPMVLKAHAKKLKADPQIWSFVTGDRDNVTRLAARFGLGVMRDEQNPIDISHTLRTAVLDTEGRLVNIYTGNSWKVEELLADLKTITSSQH